MVSYLIPGLSAFCLVWLLMPVARVVALKAKLLDLPRGRKSHAQPMPLSGGLAMFAGVAAVSIFFAGVQKLVAVLLGGSLLLVAVGWLDDTYKTRGKDFPALPKLLMQLLAGLLAFASGIRFRGLGFSWIGGEAGDYYLFPLWLSCLATLLWITGLINMINFLDGVDGLAAGATVFSAITLFFLAYVKGQGLTALVAIVLAGAALGFLRFNFFPAKMFMGDTGSMFLGYALALVSLEGAMKGATLITLVVTVLALGLPVIDTVQVMVSRAMAGSPMYQADRRHVHHRLMSLGLSAKQTVVILYLVSFLFSALSLLLFFWIIP
ncbi:undecaprenyl/decaprenyl-phosphate alpha-N-acetylglucosaminyl 1-phosphate transferase [Brevibacillus ruminantium]|uniref:Undecaprenyl/decaprenyl-phosphate alpha-N-acetylglucosaminyl 1-phosphate transferase n=1 Tax=Brevibacillus ruminantium TaxID=2950604 RepID=A0ABY4WK65_9BACL|nr:MraY family glycosyltransferase [Brevibacillus ruminantium]USG66452.1 undecaprenyl/decaprenyl-phosphate alpha-N-acetylglucosaminyl 1-phosphate transferase [Brevibacillus ruminantium]